MMYMAVASTEQPLAMARAPSRMVASEAMTAGRGRRRSIAISSFIRDCCVRSTHPESNYPFAQHQGCCNGDQCDYYRFARLPQEPLSTKCGEDGADRGQGGGHGQQSSAHVHSQGVAPLAMRRIGPGRRHSTCGTADTCHDSETARRQTELFVRTKAP